MHKINIYIIIVFFVLLASAVFAERTVKTVEYPLGFVASASANQDYVTTLNITSPDGISQILSLEIILQGDFQTTTAVNGRINSSNGMLNCTPSTWTTPVLSQGVAGYNVNFDCTSLINNWKGGVKQAGFRVNKVAQNVYATLKVTYYNQPQGTADIHGTEYFSGDQGRIFLQLEDDQGLPEDSGACYLDIYYPYMINDTYPKFRTNVPMMSVGENGLYHYDFTVPNDLGVYMIAASCAYEFAGGFVYSLEGTETFSSTRNITYGTYTGGTIFLNDFEDWIYTKCVSQVGGGGSKYCTASYDFNTSLHFGNITNVTNINLYYMGESSVVMTGIFKVWNWTNNSWITLPNTVLFSGTATSAPLGIGDFASNSIPISNTISSNGIIRVQTDFSSGTSFSTYDNWLNIRLLTASGIVQDVKGSGEVHVTGSSTEINKNFKILTCNELMDGSCGVFTNDEEYDLQEGEIEDFFNATAVITKQDAILTYTTPPYVDCSALYWIKEWNSSDWIDFEDYTVSSNVFSEDCIISLEKDTTFGTTYQFWIKMDNYMKWEVDWSRKILTSVNDSVRPLCNNRNFTYENPITDTTPITNDSITDFCYQFYDDMYWSDSLYADSQIVVTAGEYVSYVNEMRFYRNVIIDKYLFLASGNNTALTAEYYASKAWTYNNRSLTSDVTVTGNVSVGGNISAIVQNIQDIADSVTNGTAIIFLGGTEYSPNASGKIAVRLVKGSGTSAAVDIGGNCTLTILYPNQSIFSSANMTEVPSVGVYYYNFVAPSTLGVYTYYTDCVVGTGASSRKYFGLDTFHVHDLVQNSTLQSAVTDLKSYMDTLNITATVNLTQVYSEFDDMEQRLMDIALQQVHDGQFTEEQIYLITDAITQISSIREDIKKGIVGEAQGKGEISQVKRLLFSNKDMFYNPNEIYLSYVDDNCIASITNEGDTVGAYEVTMNVGNKQVVHTLNINPGEKQAAAISLSGLKAGSYICQSVSRYSGGTSKAEMNIEYKLSDVIEKKDFWSVLKPVIINRYTMMAGSLITIMGAVTLLFRQRLNKNKQEEIT